MEAWTTFESFSRDVESRVPTQAGRTGSETGPEEDSWESDVDPETVARTIVLRRLSIQARTREELLTALKAKRVPLDVAEKVLDRMEEVGLVDDTQFAQDWVESRQQRRQLSRRGLRKELSAKGVDDSQIEAALQDVGHEDELTAARSLAAKKLRTMGALDRQVKYRRLAGALGRRGFATGVVSQVLSEALTHTKNED